MNKNLPPYVLKRSARSRHIRLRVLPGGRVVVTVPHQVSEESVKSFIASHATWLAGKVEYFKKFPEHRLSLRQEKKLFLAYKQKAQVFAEEKIKKWNEHYQFTFKKIAIRNSRSRWGSCSNAGTLSFNYKIIFLPENLADYLVVHELCHLKEHNHSQAFWFLVSQRVSDYAVCRRALREFERTFKFPIEEV
ncbi:MAG: SprT family zinc-dependent metalloprotease [bacterium]|nr:SprT family zinc-dependent metalloprotease [bacterium]